MKNKYNVRTCNNCKFDNTEDCPKPVHNRGQSSKYCKKHKFVEWVAKMNLFK